LCKLLLVCYKTFVRFVQQGLWCTACLLKVFIRFLEMKQNFIGRLIIFKQVFVTNQYVLPKMFAMLDC